MLNLSGGCKGKGGCICHKYSLSLCVARCQLTLKSNLSLETQDMATEDINKSLNTFRSQLMLNNTQQWKTTKN